MGNIIEFFKDKDKLLIEASKNGNLDLVKQLIKNGANFKAENSQAFIYASRNNHIEIVRYLILKGVDIYAQNHDAFIHASQNDHLDLLKDLILYVDTIDRKFIISKLLIIAIKSYNLNIVKYLVSEGADKNQALIEASRAYNLDIVKYLISEGADIHAQNDQALINASANVNWPNNSMNLNIDLIEYLISEGADIYAQNNKILFNMNFGILNYLIEKKSSIEMYKTIINVNICIYDTLTIYTLLILYRNIESKELFNDFLNQLLIKVNIIDKYIMLVNNGADISLINNEEFKEYKDVMIKFYKNLETKNNESINELYRQYNNKYKLSDNIYFISYRLKK